MKKLDNLSLHWNFIFSYFINIKTEHHEKKAWLSNRFIRLGKCNLQIDPMPKLRRPLSLF